MSVDTRGFVQYLIRHIDMEGLLGEGYSTEERLNDIEDMIWDAYYKFSKERFDGTKTD